MITNILKDGKVVKDLTGHIVKKEDVPAAYALIERIRKGRRKNGKANTNQSDPAEMP